MKKLFILALAAMFCMAGFAKSTQEVINEITKSTGAQAITLSKDGSITYFRGTTLVHSILADTASKLRQNFFCLQPDALTGAPVAD